MTAFESRMEKRAMFTPEQRITLLEQDADTQDALMKNIDGKLNKLLWFAVTALVTFTTAAILLAVDLATRL